MGYTHYWRMSRPFTDESWKSFVKEVKSIFSKTDVPLANGCGEVETKPVFDHGRMMFNGVEYDSHETCVITKGMTDFSFCKTARKPYDKVVVKVLKAAQKFNPGIALTSDGGPEVFENA